MHCTDAYKERVAYDANGNILSYIRNGANVTGMPRAMDSLTYRYLPNSNKLDHVDDTIPASNYAVDFDDQDTLNNKFDKDSAQNFSLINKVALNMIRNYKPEEARGSKKISMIRKRKMANRDNDYLLDILLSFNTEKH